MKTSKLAVVFALLLALSLLTACSGGNQEDENTLERPFIGGVKGLSLSVLDGAPPPTVTDGETMDFGIVLSMENVGESDVGPGTENPFVQARLKGVDPKNWGATKEEFVQEVNTRIAGAKKNFDGTILPGEVATASFQPLNFQYKVGESEIFRFRAEVCYDYATHSTLQVCVKDDILEQMQDDTLCRLRSQLNPRNSGGPLHVVEADQNPVGDEKIQVNFAIKNLDDGVFFNRKASGRGACDTSIRNPDMYQALVVVNPVDTTNYDLDCRGLDDSKPGFAGIDPPPASEFGVLKLRDNAPRSLTCFMEKTTNISGRVFQDLMEIDIYYRYADFLDIPILVQNSGTADMSKVPKGFPETSDGSSG